MVPDTVVKYSVKDTESTCSMVMYAVLKNVQWLSTSCMIRSTLVPCTATNFAEVRHVV
jgi:hypothetical protein